MTIIHINNIAFQPPLGGANRQLVEKYNPDEFQDSDLEILDEEVDNDGTFRGLNTTIHTVNTRSDTSTCLTKYIMKLKRKMDIKLSVLICN